MPPKRKVKGTKRKGADPTPPGQKNRKKANHASHVQEEEESLTDDEISFQRQGIMMQLMSHMMDLFLDLSDRVRAAETQISPREESPSASPSTQRTARRRVHCHSTSTRDQQVSSAARKKVARKIRELHLAEEMASDEGLDSDEDQYITFRHIPLKSGLDRTGVTMVVKNISWPHKVVYSSAGNPATY